MIADLTYRTTSAYDSYLTYLTTLDRTQLLAKVRARPGIKEQQKVDGKWVSKKKADMIADPPGVSEKKKVNGKW